MKYKVTLNGRVYEVVVEKGEAVLEAEYALSEQPAPVQANAPAARTGSPEPLPAASEGDITAPFPGSVVKICRQTGEYVKKGEPLIIIEAMKMENEIAAPKDGRVSAVYVSKGQSVDKGTPLVSLS